MELKNWENYGLSSRESIWMSGADFVMCLENLTFSWDEVTGVILWVNSLESKKRLWVRLGLLLGRSGQPRFHARAEWGLRPFEDVQCGVKSAEWVKQIMFNNYNLLMITLWKARKKSPGLNILNQTTSSSLVWRSVKRQAVSTDYQMEEKVAVFLGSRGSLRKDDVS